MAIKEKFLRKNDDTKMWNVRLTDAERYIIDKNAKQFTDGNASAWVRFAATHLKPTKRYLTRSKGS